MFSSIPSNQSIPSAEATQRLDANDSLSPNVLEPQRAKFSESGQITEKILAAKEITQYLSNPALDMGTIKSFPKPNGFTLFHFLAIGNKVHEGTTTDEYFERLCSDPDLLNDLVRKTDCKSAVELGFYMSDPVEQMPLANGDQPAHLAIFMGNKKVLQSILNKLPDSGEMRCEKNNTGNNYFNLAAGKNLEMLELLCDHFRGQEEFNSFITSQTSGGKTPLHHAAKSQHKERLEVFAKLLVEGAGTSIDIEDNYGKKPLDYMASLQDDFPKLKEEVIKQLSADEDEGKRQRITGILDNAFQAIKNDPEIAVDNSGFIIL